MNNQVAYLLSFLAILVQRNGGTLVIENLSRQAGTNVALEMDLDLEHDRVTLKTSAGKRVPPPKHVVN